MAKLYILAGPDKGREFQLKDGSVYVGRSPDNHIQLTDMAVSRRHLKIFTRGGAYFIKDLESENGTFVEGKEVPAGVETMIEEGVPIVVGMSVLCVGKGCLEQVMPVLESIELSETIAKDSGIFLQHKTRTTEKIMELIYNVTELLALQLDVTRTMERILDYVFDFLRNIDRAVIILVDSETGERTKVVSRIREPGEERPAMYNEDVVERVLREGKGLMVSDVRTEKEQALADTLRLSRIQSMICVPLISHSRVRGVIYADSLKEPYGFRKEDLSLFADLGRRAALAIDHAMFYARPSIE